MAVSTVPAPVLEILRFEYRQLIKPAKKIHFSLYTPYHYNTNPSSPTIAKTQTPYHQLIIEIQPSATSLTSRLALSNIYPVL
jgi:hypothetical protein